MSDAVVPHKAETNAPRAPSSSSGLFKRAIESDLFYSFRRSKITMVAAAITLLFFLLAIFASVIAVQNPFDPAQLQLINSRIPPLWEADGQMPYLLGTDEQGRDVLSAIFVTINFFVDLLYAAIDPRLRLDRARLGTAGG